MSRFLRAGSVPALLAMLLSVTVYAMPVSAAAQEDTRREVSPDYAAELSAGRCYESGREYGNDHTPSGGNFAAGLVGGLVLGLIGTAFVWSTVSKPSVPSEDLLVAEELGCDGASWIRGYEDGGRSRKRKSALIGGLVGTGVVVAFILAVSSD